MKRIFILGAVKNGLWRLKERLLRRKEGENKGQSVRMEEETFKGEKYNFGSSFYCGKSRINIME